MKKVLATVFVMFSSAVCFANFPLEEYQAKTYVAPNGESMNYRVLLPENYDADKKFPLVLFLHGAGERGADNLAQLRHGGGMFTNPVNREKYPAIVLFPQCPAELYWPFDTRPDRGFSLGAFPESYPISPALSMAKGLLDQYIDSGKVDTRRIYVIGLSMGAMGTFDLVCRYPELFAAAVPICGGVNPLRLKQATPVAFRIFHGDDDNVVPCENSRKAYEALKLYGAEVEYIEFPGVNHGSWTPAFNTPDFMEWIFNQRKK